MSATYIATIRPAELALYQRAVAEYADPDVYVEGLELHDRQLFRDLTRFWDLFERLETTGEFT